MFTTLLSLFVLAQAPVAPSETPVAETPVAGTADIADPQVFPLESLVAPPEPQVAPPQARFRGALELSVGTLPSGVPGGQQDGFGFVLPIVALDVRPNFRIELGAELRMRALDFPPEQRATDFKGFLRGEDWDEASDFGQLLRELRIGSEESFLLVHAGAIRDFTLGHGHLLSRYDNQLNPNYHPAGASIRLAVAPVQVRLLASDLLAPRIFAGELSLDLGHVASPEEKFHDRYHAAISVAHDTGATGALNLAERLEPVSILQLDADAALYRGEQFRLFALAGGGLRLHEEPQLNALVGLAAEGSLGTVQLGGRLEGRKPGKQFPVGMMGATYELSRFSAKGLGFEGIASEELPDGFSGYAEVSVTWGSAEPLEQPEPYVSFSASAEYFTWGRLDAGARLVVRLPEQKGTVTARLALLGLLEAPRYDGGFEVRYRLLPSLYVVGAGGTVFFPQPDASLVRGLYAALGVGLDFER